MGHEVRVSRGDGLPAVAARVVGVGQAEHAHQPRFAVAAVVGEGLARPFAGHQHAPSGVAEVVGPVGFALAPARPHSLVGVFGLDAVAQPVRARRGARFVPQRIQQPGGVLLLGGGVGGVAAADLFGQLLGQVPDAPAGVAGSRRARIALPN
jgi:hypothetical protein